MPRRATMGGNVPRGKRVLWTMLRAYGKRREGRAREYNIVRIQAIGKGRKKEPRRLTRSLWPPTRAADLLSFLTVAALAFRILLSEFKRVHGKRFHFTGVLRLISSIDAPNVQRSFYIHGSY